MGVALESAWELIPLLLWGVAWGLIALMTVLIALGKAHLNPSIVGVRPFAGAWDTLEALANRALKASADGVEKAWSGLLNGLQLAFAIIILLAALPILGTKAALEYLWAHALRPLIASFVNPVRDIAIEARTLARTTEKELRSAGGAAEAAIRAAEASAVRTARAYTDHATGAAVSTLTRYADEAVATLRAAEDAAIAEAARITHDAIAALPAPVGVGISEVEAAAAGAVATAEAAAQSALAGVQAIAVTAEHDVTALEEYVKGLNVESLIAALPAVATLVSVIAVESGLENAACRSKVKGICGTDPAAWAGLLGGLAVLGFGFNLRELYGVANGLVGDLSSVIREAA